jgi:hypothetical protein
LIPTDVVVGEICTRTCSDFQASLLLQAFLVELVFATADDNALSVLKISGYVLFRFIADGEGKDARSSDKWLQAPPNPDDAVEAKIAEQYKTDRAGWDKEAKKWTKRYAKK